MKILEIMISVFTNTPELTNSSKTVKKMLNIFENDEVIFNSIQLVNITGDKQTVLNRPQVVNQSDKWRVDFLPERIDWVISFDQNKKYSDSDIYGKVTAAVDGFNAIYDEFSFKASRFSINTNYIFDKPDKIDVDCFLAASHVNGKDSLHEWSIRKNYRRDIELKDVGETLNIIEEVNRVNDNEINLGGRQIKVNGLLTHYDINTSHYARGERLDKIQFEEFVKIAHSIEKENRLNFEGEIK